jgi:nitroreductase
MTIAESIFHRRNISPDAFNGQAIATEVIKQLLEAANQAPTHGYTEPWRFVVYESAAIKKFTSEHADLYKAHTSSEKYTEANFLKIKHRGDKASHLIAVYMKRGTNPKIPRLEEISAVACAIQNIWLLASSMQIGMYWGTGGMVHHSAMKSYFSLSEEDEMMGLLFLGYSDLEWPKGRRIVPMEEKVQWIKE